jgi:hypothetical protein
MIRVVDVGHNWWSVQINDREIDQWFTKVAVDTVANRIRSALASVTDEAHLIRLARDAQRRYQALTPEGYAVESETEKGSVQIYPAAALALKEDEGYD